MVTLQKTAHAAFDASRHFMLASSWGTQEIDFTLARSSRPARQHERFDVLSLIVAGSTVPTQKLGNVS
jgi:hypothetical protein